MPAAPNITQQQPTTDLHSGFFLAAPGFAQEKKAWRSFDLKMPLIRHYSHVKKPWKDGTWEAFFPVRVLGLCLEKAYKTSSEKGLGCLTLEDLATVELSGDLKVKAGATFRTVEECTLKVAEQDASLALQICKKQRAWLHDLGVNVWKVDKPMGHGMGSFDLLCDSSQKSSLLSIQHGMLWVELKVLAAKTCRERMAKIEPELEAKLEKVSRKHEHIRAVLLLVSEVSKASRTQWGKPKLLAKLFTLSTGQWQDVSSSGVRVGKGQVAAASKPPVSILWPKMEFFKVSGKVQGLFKHFLQAMGLASHSPGKRAATLNKALKKQGVKGKLVQKRIPNRPGKPVWMGTKSVLKALHKKVL